MVWLLLWTIVGFAVDCVIWSLGAFLWQENFCRRELSEILFYLIVGPLVFGISAYLFNLPFMILTFMFSTYRERFYIVLRLPQRLPPTPVPSEACTEEECKLP
jgi:hypothetical protein